MDNISPEFLAELHGLFPSSPLEDEFEARRLAADIERAVRSRTGRRIRDLKVEVGPGGIRLSGRCATFYAKQLAQEAAMTLTVDEVIINAIRVH